MKQKNELPPHVIEAIREGRYTEESYHRYQKLERKERARMSRAFFILEYAPILTLVLAAASAVVACASLIIMLSRIL